MLSVIYLLMNTGLSNSHFQSFGLKGGNKIRPRLSGRSAQPSQPIRRTNEHWGALSLASFVSDEFDDELFPRKRTGAGFHFHFFEGAHHVACCIIVCMHACCMRRPAPMCRGQHHMVPPSTAASLWPGMDQSGPGLFSPAHSSTDDIGVFALYFSRRRLSRCDDHSIVSLYFFTTYQRNVGF